MEGETASPWLAFLESGGLLEPVRGAAHLYDRHLVLAHGSNPYEMLVAQDGALVRFEERRQAGELERRPVRVTLEGREYLVTETGTMAATRAGEPPTLAPWRTLREDAARNVYFRLRATAGSSVALGLWTDDVCVSFTRAPG